jgi:hypothetical protein
MFFYLASEQYVNLKMPSPMFYRICHWSILHFVLHLTIWQVDENATRLVGNKVFMTFG